MKSKVLLSLLAATALALPAGVSAAPVKGVKKLCPGYSVPIPYKKACPAPPVVVPPDPEPEPVDVPLNIAVTDVQVNENAGTVTITVLRDGSNGLAWGYNYATSNGTATAGSDYTSTTGSKSVLSSVSTSTFTVPITDDGSPESNETFTVTISVPVNVTIQDATGLVTIVNANDVVAPPTPPPPPPGPVLPPPSITVLDRTVGENIGQANIMVTKTGTTTASSSVRYTAHNGTAVAGSDYTATTGVLTIPAGGSGTYSFNVPIVNDATNEGDETFTITLEDAVNATLSDALATVLIVDDDDPAPPPVPPIVVPGTSQDEPAESLEGYTWRTVPHNYLNDLVAIPVNNLSAGSDPVGAYRMVCGSGVAGYFDPVVYPGENGKSHYHRFNGNNGVTASSNFDNLMTNGATSSCQSGNATASQRSSYWMPAWLLANGNEVVFDTNSVYYKRIPASSPDCGTPTGTGFGPRGICLEIPNGLKMVIGSKMVSGQYGPANYNMTVRPVKFQCVSDGKNYNNIALMAAGSPSCLKPAMIAEFPDCWDGANLWKVDRSHVVYQRNYNTDGKLRCPPTHPYLITQLAIHYYFTLQPGELAGSKLASDYMDLSLPAGWSLHADADIVWDARIKRMIHDNCINRHLNCSGGDTGGGYRLRGGDKPSYGFIQPNRVQSVPSMPPNMVMPGG